MLTVNQVLQKRYRITRQLGHGGMGAVYEAIDERFGEPIALKEIIIELADPRQQHIVSKAFEREAKSLAKANHEVVPYVRDYFTELNRQFLVMELIEGDDLAEMLYKQKSPFSLKDVFNWMDQLLDALDYLHNLNPPIIHRDIKPQNLKLNFRRKIKLLDFGISKSIDNVGATITNQTFVGATQYYSPLEQTLRVIDANFQEFILLQYKEHAERLLSQATDARCDIYAVGATFYHLLTNTVPTDVIKRALEIWKGNPDPIINPLQLNPQIPASMAAFLLKAISLERENRFSSAIEMQDELKTIIAEERTRQREKNAPPVITQLLSDVQNSSQPQTLPQQSIEKPIATNEIAIGTNQDISLITQSTPIELQVAPATLREISVPPPDVSKPFPLKAPETQSSGIVAKPPTNPIIDRTIPDQKLVTSTPIFLAEKAHEPRFAFKALWLIPIGALGILAILGLGGTILLTNFLWSQPQQPITDSVNALPSSTTAATTISPTPTPRISPKQTPTKDGAKVENPKPVNTPVINKPPAQTSTKKPATEPKQDPNCVFTNSCK